MMFLQLIVRRYSLNFQLCMYVKVQISSFRQLRIAIAYITFPPLTPPRRQSIWLYSICLFLESLYTVGTCVYFSGHCVQICRKFNFMLD